MRRDLPWLAALYGLRWEDIATMPRAELEEYQRQFNEVRQTLRGGPGG